MVHSVFAVPSVWSYHNRNERIGYQSVHRVQLSVARQVLAHVAGTIVAHGKDRVNMQTGGAAKISKKIVILQQDERIADFGINDTATP
jgi:hypothetical protein